MIHVPLAAETVFHIWSFPVTNAQVNATFALLILTIVAVTVRFSVSLIPGSVQNAAEGLIEWVLGYFDRVTHDHERSKRFLPLVGTLFFFILLSNWMGLLPGTGSIGFWIVESGERLWVPLFRPAMSDLNLTLAMALISVICAHIIGAGEQGAWAHINKFIQIEKIWKAIKKLNPVGLLTALIEFVVGLIELVGEFAKIASLSLRLFGNVFAGEVLMTVIASMIAFLVPLPFMALEMIVGLVQATVFAMLTLVYLTVLSMPPHGEHHAEGHETKNTSHATPLHAK